ncbi:hypothetical protein Syun_011662 [Stephania yunnanensis]|uniref:Uncharacterized protein n=1 Tax=Stephania yunnanensis TaxID=152371 RepID=A0AAP0K0D4_9MAGN
MSMETTLAEEEKTISSRSGRAIETKICARNEEMEKYCSLSLSFRRTRKAYNTLLSSAVCIQTGMKVMVARSDLRFRLQTRATILIQYHMGRAMADVSLQLPGVHNVLNSLAVIATVGALIDDQKLPYLNFHLTVPECGTIVATALVANHREPIHGSKWFDPSMNVWSLYVLEQLIFRCPGCNTLVVSKFKFPTVYDTSDELELLREEEALSLFCHATFGQKCMAID